MSDSLFKEIPSYTRGTDRLDSATTKCNGVAVNCFVVSLVSGTAQKRFRIKLSLVIHQTNVGEAFDDMGRANVDDVRETHNAVVFVMKVDVLSSQ
jgi:hypothetical protein